jgi:glycerol-3-phosphate cytidylyltransferase
MKIILTYGTYDLMHYGHIKLLKRARELGDFLVVGLSTDEFNELKGKKSYYCYETRKHMLEAVRHVDLVVPEEEWEQKISDIQKYNASILVMGDDWEGDPRFSKLSKYCDVVYLNRTKGISTTQIKNELGAKGSSK